MSSLQKLPDIQSSKLNKLSRIGGGAYGRVYAAQKSSQSTIAPFTTGIYLQSNPLIERSETYAVKRNFISPSLQESVGSIREMDILNLVKDHPYCLQLKDVSFEIPFADGILSPGNKNCVTDKVFFVMERGELDGEKYIHGGKYQVLGRTVMEPLVNERKLFALHIFLAIEFLHSREIYHRDLKPANIICMMTSDGRLESAKITDFGLTQYYSDQVMSLPGFVTLWYRAPEISLMKAYDIKVDVWSLGCILFELFSLGNRRFIQSNTEESMINTMIEKLPFPKDDYTLALNLYQRKITRNYDYLQSNLKSLKEQMACTESQIAQFNSMQLGGKINYGTYDELIDLLSHMLVVDSTERWSMSECLNHNFFDGFREIIDSMRTRFGINNKGDWILRPDYELSYINNNLRTIAMKWFSIIYTKRAISTIACWYSHQIFFHALEMFDRFNMMTNIREEVHEGTIVIWINVFLFISAKYFRVMVPEIGLEMFSIGIVPEEYHIFRQRALQFEENVVRDIFKLEIYRPTIYETANDFLTETSIIYLIHSLLKAEIPSGTSLRMIWSLYSDILLQLNRTSSPVDSPETPVISLITYK